MIEKKILLVQNLYTEKKERLFPIQMLFHTITMFNANLLAECLVHCYHEMFISSFSLTSLDLQKIPTCSSKISNINQL